jgi:O-antigen ligase
MLWSFPAVWGNPERLQKVPGGVELFFFYLLAAAAPLSIFSINIAQGGLTLFFLTRLARRRVRFGPTQWILLAFFAWSAMAALLSPLPRASLMGVLDYWSWTPFLLASALPGEIRAKEPRFAWFLAIAACLTVPMDLAQFFLGTDFKHGQHLFRHAPAGTVNAYGFFSHHLTYAGVVCLVLFMAGGLALYGPGKRKGWWVAVALLGAGLVTTMARGYTLASVPAGLALFWNKGRRWLLMAGGTALVVALVLLLAGPQKLRERAASLWDVRHPSNAERIYLWVSGWQMAMEHPVAGWGPGKVYEQCSGPFRAPYAAEIRYPDKVGFRTTAHCHNLYLMVLIQEGAVGLGLFILFFVLALKDLLRQPDLALRYGVLAGAVAFLAGGFFEFNAGDAEVATLAFFLLGLACRGTLEEPR